jgi:hypothetical protein
MVEANRPLFGGQRQVVEAKQRLALQARPLRSQRKILQPHQKHRHYRESFPPLKNPTAKSRDHPLGNGFPTAQLSSSDLFQA